MNEINISSSVSQIAIQLIKKHAIELNDEEKLIIGSIYGAFQAKTPCTIYAFKRFQEITEKYININVHEVRKY